MWRSYRASRLRHVDAGDSVTLIARSTSAEVGTIAAAWSVPYRLRYGGHQGAHRRPSRCSIGPAIGAPIADRVIAQGRSTRAATPHRSCESQRTRRPSPRHNATPPRRRNESSTIFHARNFRRPEGRSASRASAPQRPSQPSSVAARAAAEDLCAPTSSPLSSAPRSSRPDSPSVDDAITSGTGRAAQEPTGDTDQSPQHSARPAILAASETTSASRKKLCKNKGL